VLIEFVNTKQTLQTCLSDGTDVGIDRFMHHTLYGFVATSWQQRVWKETKKIEEFYIKVTSLYYYLYRYVFGLSQVSKTPIKPTASTLMQNSYSFIDV